MTEIDLNTVDKWIIDNGVLRHFEFSHTPTGDTEIHVEFEDLRKALHWDFTDPNTYVLDTSQGYSSYEKVFDKSGRQHTLTQLSKSLQPRFDPQELAPKWDYGLASQQSPEPAQGDLRYMTADLKFKTLLIVAKPTQPPALPSSGSLNLNVAHIDGSTANAALYHKVLNPGSATVFSDYDQGQNTTQAQISADVGKKRFYALMGGRLYVDNVTDEQPQEFSQDGTLHIGGIPGQSPQGFSGHIYEIIGFDDLLMMEELEYYKAALSIKHSIDL